jgi:hypothetical protein
MMATLKERPPAVTAILSTQTASESRKTINGFEYTLETRPMPDIYRGLASPNSGVKKCPESVFLIATVTIGPGCEISDLYFDWTERREIAEDGCLLVRPDLHVAWRRHTGVGSSHGDDLRGP